MNIQKHILLVLMVPLVVYPANMVQQDGLIITAATSAEGDQIFQVGTTVFKGKDFVFRGLQPVWIEITNNSHETVSITPDSVSLSQVQKSELQKKFKSRAILYPLLASSAVSMSLRVLAWPHILDLSNAALHHLSVKNSMMSADRAQIEDLISKFNNLKQRAENGLQNEEERKKYQQDLSQYEQALQTHKQKGKLVKEQIEYTHNLNKKLLGRVCIYLGLHFSVVVTGVYSWWRLSHFNTQFDLELDKWLLQDVVHIEPGQTVKKLIVLGAKDMQNTFELNVIDPSTKIVKVNCPIVL